MTDLIKTRFEVLDERFRPVNGDEWIQRLHTGCRWVEGPAYFPAGSLPRLQRHPPAGPAGELRAGQSAGHPHRARRLRHRPGRPLRRQAVQQSQRRRRAVGWLDLVHRPELRHRQRLRRDKAPSEIGGCHVYRLEPDTGSVHLVADDSTAPTGWPFLSTSAGSTSSIPATSTSAVSKSPETVRSPAGRSSPTATPAPLTASQLDDAGRVWAAAHDGVHCFDQDGTLIGKLHLPEIVSNLTFGGLKRNDLFITASGSVYSLRANVTGARYPSASQRRA